MKKQQQQKTWGWVLYKEFLKFIILVAGKSKQHSAN